MLCRRASFAGACLVVLAIGCAADAQPPVLTGAGRAAIAPNGNTSEDVAAAATQTSPSETART